MSCVDLHLSRFYTVLIYQYTYIFIVFRISVMYRAQDKREYLMIIRDNFCLFLFILGKNKYCYPHLNRLDDTVQIRDNNICFQ